MVDLYFPAREVFLTLTTLIFVLLGLALAGVRPACAVSGFVDRLPALAGSPQSGLEELDDVIHIKNFETVIGNIGEERRCDFS